MPLLPRVKRQPYRPMSCTTRPVRIYGKRSPACEYEGMKRPDRHFDVEWQPALSGVGSNIDPRWSASFGLRSYAAASS